MARQINNGLQTYFKQIKEIPLLTAEKEKELVIKAQAGDENARNDLVAANLRLVLIAAKHYNSNTSLSFEDLVQEGNIGLVRATKDFDISKGFRFTTYAMYWIKQAISRAILNHSHSIRIPAHIAEQLSKMKKAEKAFFDNFKREATEEELAKELNLSVAKIKELKSIVKDPISIHTSLNDEDDGTIEDLIADPNVEVPDQKMDNEFLANAINTLLPTLDKREQEVIIARYGLNGVKVKTLDQLGAEYGISKERIRQIEQKALIKLRHPLRADVLRPYFA